MNQLSNVSLYDVKAYVRKAQNAVLNFTDMEAKVREATNNEPWGTPTSVMQQIADATNNYQQFHEIMPFVFRRFTEKSASEWRQIYKALTLLDYLVLNGSERVVDYARSHISVIEMLRHFGYVDSKGTDQGASIRKRSEELVALLKNVEKLRAERKKAKVLLAKTGAGTSAVGSSTSIGGAIGGSSRYAGASFNTPSFQSGSGFAGSGRKYGGLSSDQYRSMQFRQGGSGSRGGAAAAAAAEDTADDFSARHFSAPAQSDDFEEYTVETTSKPAAAGAKNEAEDDDDDFADFQSAPTASASKPSTTANILDLFDAPIPASSVPSTSVPSTSVPSTSVPSPSTPAASFTPTPAASGATFASSSFTAHSSSSSSATAAAAAAAPQNDLFDSLWESSKTNTKPVSKPASQPAQTQPAAPKPASEIEDLLSF